MPGEVRTPDVPAEPHGEERRALEDEASAGLHLRQPVEEPLVRVPDEHVLSDVTGGARVVDQPRVDRGGQGHDRASR